MAETSSKATTKKLATSAKPAAKKTAAKASTPATAKKTAAKPVVAEKATTPKKAAAPKKQAVKKTTVTIEVDSPKIMLVSDEQRYRMIAEAAYYRAESNNFRSDPVRDWIEAEKDITALLSGSSR